MKKIKMVVYQYLIDQKIAPQNNDITIGTNFIAVIMYFRIIRLFV